MSEAKTGQDSNYNKQFIESLKPILKQQESVCKSACDSVCGICGEPTKETLQTPMSWLHREENPFIGVWVSAVCSNGNCEFQTRKTIQETMLEAGGGIPGSGISTATEVLFCAW